MMNLLGCTKEDFYKLMLKMNYKKTKEEDTYIFTGNMRKIKKLLTNLEKLMIILSKNY